MRRIAGILMLVMITAFVVAVAMESKVAPEGSIKMILDQVLLLLGIAGGTFILWLALKWTFGEDTKKGSNKPSDIK